MGFTVNKEDLEKLLSLTNAELKIWLPRKGVEIETDPYWYITPSEWSAMDKDLQPALGLLSEDWELLQSVLSGDQPFSTLVLEKIAFLLLAIGETIIPKKSG